MNADPLRLLAVTSLALALAIPLVWMLRAPLRRTCGAQAAYALWLAVPCALAASLLPARVQVVATPMHAVAVAAPAAPAVAARPGGAAAATWLLLAWGGGAAAALVLLLRQQRRFVRALGRVTPLADGCHRAEHGAGCPAVVGLWPPRLVLPPDFAARYGPEERALILAHERQHLARGDVYANALAAGLRCLFWFHPLVHLAVARFRRDQELACDAAVLRRHPGAGRVYADAMLKTQLAVLGLPVGCHWQSSHPLVERVAMLKNPLPNPLRRAVGAGLVLTVALGGACAAWAAQPAQVVTEPTVAAATASIQASFQLVVDGDERKTFSVVAREGEPFAFRSDSASVWEGEFTATRAADGGFQLAGTLKRDGVIAGRPTLRMGDGQPGRITLGEERDGRFRGVDLTATLRMLTAAEVRDLPHAGAAKATDPPAPRAPLEKVAAGDPRQPPPPYPAAALQHRTGGKVVLRVEVQADGTPGRIELASVDVRGAQGRAITPETQAADAEALVAASARAVRGWRFTPAEQEGQAVSRWVLVPLTFSLEGPDA